MVNVLYLCLFHRPYTTYNSALWGSCSRVGTFPPSLSLYVLQLQPRIQPLCTFLLSAYICHLLFSAWHFINWQNHLLANVIYTTTCTSGMEDIGILSFMWVYSSECDASKGESLKTLFDCGCGLVGWSHTNSLLSSITQSEMRNTTGLCNLSAPVCILDKRF